MSARRDRGLTRRAFVAAPWALAACGVPQAPGADAPALEGGWVGADPARGHRLRTPDAGAAFAPPAVTRRCGVVIVGAGIAGLAAARALVRAGVDDVQLLELEDAPGGNSRGHAIAGLACPLGAHYLPLPGPDAHEVAELLHELGLARHELGRTVYDERHLCHSPQERLWLDGQWLDGLLPPAARGSEREARYRRFAQLVDEVSRAARFAMPTARAPWTAAHAALDAQTFAHWLDRHGLDDAGLRWYLDYCCRDDYGAGADRVSAWAGLHYFASRHGFHAPGDDVAAEREAVLTWPEGNAWIAQRLAQPLRDRLHAGRVALRVDASRHEATVDAWHVAADRLERWSARHVVLAVPLHVAARLCTAPSNALRDAAAALPHAPWLVANLHLPEPLTDKPGAPPAWDNVLYGSESLGYVDAMHQSLRPHPGPTVITAYWALPEADRAALLAQPWQWWARRVVDDLARAHPDLPRKLGRIELARYGHAMAVPAPGVRGHAALSALREGAAAGARVQVAHSDLSGYSVFEEAYHHGLRAGERVAAALGLSRASAPRSRRASPARRG